MSVPADRSDPRKLAEDLLSARTDVAGGSINVWLARDVARELLAALDREAKLNEYLAEHGDPRALRAEVAEFRSVLWEIGDTSRYRRRDMRLPFEIARAALAGSSGCSS